MADIVTFDPDTLRIIEIDAGGDNELTVLEVYSEWKDWLLADPSRLGYPSAFRVVGGDPVSGTQSLGSTFFLTNGWRIRPAESTHKLILSGNIFTDPAGESVFTPTLGAFNVNTETQVSNIIDLVEGTAVTDPAAVSAAVWAASSGGVTYGTMLYETMVMLGLHPTIVVEHGKTYIRAPASGSLLNLQVTKVGDTVTLTRL